MMVPNTLRRWVDEIPSRITKAAEGRQLGEIRSLCQEHGRRNHTGRDYYVFEHGFIYSRKILGFLRVRQIVHRWDEVKSVVFNKDERAREMPGEDNLSPQYAVIADFIFTNGETFRGKCWGWRFQHRASLYRFIADNIADAQGPGIWEAYRAGREIGFGKAVVNCEGLRYGDRLFPWARLKAISFRAEDDVLSWADDLIFTLAADDRQPLTGAAGQDIVKLPATDFVNIEALRRLHLRITATPGAA